MFDLEELTKYSAKIDRIHDLATSPHGKTLDEMLEEMEKSSVNCIVNNSDNKIIHYQRARISLVRQMRRILSGAGKDYEMTRANIRRLVEKERERAEEFASGFGA